MNPFEYIRTKDAEGAVLAMSDEAKFLAGGTNLVDLMKNGIEKPKTLVDINRTGLDKIEELPDGSLRLGALARNSDTANHPMVRQHYPLLSRAILSGASPQLRNLATNGGNLLQRTRCPYFMDTGFEQCNKRNPGSGCSALGGYNRSHAIFGASKKCIAVHPSDMCVALAALDAVIRVRGKSGERHIPIAEFHRLPGDNPELDSTLQKDELILSIDLPRSPFSEHSHYLKVRDRASYEFALISVAVGLELMDGNIRRARIVLGGVAHKPWRIYEAEKVLVGGKASKELFDQTAQQAIAGAKPHKENTFKVEMAKRAVARALNVAGGLS